ncbi:MAG TPA: RDD family protein [Dissulfurispiraceae bacterium]|nr:RDD family protein [Dissulfurispiraceae bacterium]
MNGGKTGSLSIRTPEGILFSLPLAGPVARFLAWVVDLACITAVMGVIGTIAGALGVVSRDFAAAVFTVLYFSISVGYGISAEWLWRGQTVGKRLLRLRVIDAGGLKLQFSQVVIRNLIRFFDSLPAFYLVGGVSCLLTSKLQRLGDFAANTVVIRAIETTDPDVDQLLAGKFNSLRAFPHLAARLRQQISPQEAGIALQSLMRRNELDPGARIELFREIAGHLRSLVEFPEEASYGITDEQYIRNVVDIIFREKKL